MQLGKLEVFRTLGAIGVLSMGVQGHDVSAADAPAAWRKVRTFDVMDPARDLQADLGNGRVLVADHDDSTGWDIGVYKKPRRAESPNLLYDGSNQHGPQPWQVYAWTMQEATFPDVRLIEYGSPQRRLKIVLTGCEARDLDGSVAFSKGAVDVYAAP